MTPHGWFEVTSEKGRKKIKKIDRFQGREVVGAHPPWAMSHLS